MNDKPIYIKGFSKSLFPREYTLQLRRELGIPEDEIDYKSLEGIIYEICSAIATLAAVFDKSHPDNNLYDRIGLKVNHYELWSKIENDLNQLIADVFLHNRRENDCPTCGE